MSRVLPDDVVNAYYHTNLIPIRCAWSTTDNRGGCAIDALARHRGVLTDELRATFAPRYEEGFLMAWDADDPHHSAIISKIKAEDDDVVKQGFCDAMLCRSAVEKTFSATGITPVSNES